MQFSLTHLILLFFFIYNADTVSLTLKQKMACSFFFSFSFIRLLLLGLLICCLLQRGDLLWILIINHLNSLWSQWWIIHNVNLFQVFLPCNKLSVHAKCMLMTELMVVAAIVYDSAEERKRPFACRVLKMNVIGKMQSYANLF